jgi:hypothetical protein
MASVMAMESQVLDRCVGKINVSVEVENSEVLLCCGWKKLRLNLQGNRLNICGGGRRWYQVLEGTLGALGLIVELKSPCGCRGFGRLRWHQHFSHFLLLQR